MLFRIKYGASITNFFQTDMGLLKKIRLDLRDIANSDKAKILQGFFKTAPGGYSYGDKFLGVTVPKQRILAKEYYRLLGFDDVRSLLSAKIHEERMIALLILILKYEKSDAKQRQAIYNFYCKNIHCINNWDLVDVSAPKIIGAHLLDYDKTVLHKFAESRNLWQRRIAIVATLYFVRNNFYQATLTLAKKLLHDEEDLIHKATGWVLREVGKRDFKTLNNFLIKHYQMMPRTMLRYAIERLPVKLRKMYLKGRVTQ